MRAGERIIKQFGLEKLKNAQMVQWLTTPVRTLMVVYDTLRPRTPITKTFLRDFPYPVLAVDNRDLTSEIMLPPVDLEDFDGQLAGRIVILVDMAGRRADEDELTKVWEQAPAYEVRSLQEDGFTIPDFRTNGTSSRNLTFYRQRQDQGRSGSTLTSVAWNKRRDTITLQYKVVPTFDTTVGVTTKNWNAGEKGAYKQPPYARTARSYKIQVMFENVSDHVGTRSEFLDMIPGEQEAFLDAMIRDCPVRVHSNDKSFYFQGVWENGDKLGYVIHPFPGVTGTGEWSRKHTGEYPGIYTTKHILEVFYTIPTDTQTIAQRIASKYS